MQLHLPLLKRIGPQSKVPASLEHWRPLRCPNFLRLSQVSSMKQSGKKEMVGTTASGLQMLFTSTKTSVPQLYSRQGIIQKITRQDSSLGMLMQLCMTIRGKCHFYWMSYHESLPRRYMLTCYVEQNWWTPLVVIVLTCTRKTRPNTSKMQNTSMD